MFHGSGSSWNAGRNRLLRLAAACPAASSPQYLILADCDAALRVLTPAPAHAPAGPPGGGEGGAGWRALEGLLAHYEPAVG